MDIGRGAFSRPPEVPIFRRTEGRVEDTGKMPMPRTQARCFGHEHRQDAHATKLLDQLFLDGGAVLGGADLKAGLV